MTATHRYFETLCALAASGQLSQSEHKELGEHARHCVVCSNRIAEFTELSAPLFLAHASSQRSIRLPQGMRERFVARAIGEGVPLHRRSSKMDMGKPGIAAAMVLVVMVTMVARTHGPIFRPLVDSEDAVASYSSLAAPTRNYRSREVISNPRGHTLRARGSSHSTPARRAIAADPSPGSSAAAVKATFPGRHFVLEYSFSKRTKNQPELLAACESCAFSLPGFRSNFAFAAPGEQLVRGDFALDLYQPDRPPNLPRNLEPRFKLDPSAFQLIENDAR